VEEKIQINITDFTEIEGWKETVGHYLLPPEFVKRVVMPPPLPLPEGQRWSDMSKALELDDRAREYLKRGIENRPIRALQTYSTNRLHIGRKALNELWNTNIGQAWMIEEGDATEINIVSVDIPYFEAVAFARGDIPGLENPKPILVSLNVVTRDGSLVFLQRSGEVAAGENQIGIVGGTCDSDMTPMEQALAEASEELGIPKDILDENFFKLANLVEDKQGRPVFFFKLKLPFTMSELKDFFSNSKNAQQENREIIFVENDSQKLFAFAKKHPSSEFHPPADALFVIALNEAIHEEYEYIAQMGVGSTPF